MIESILAWIWINIITAISKKFNLSQTNLIAWLCFLLACGYVAIKQYNPELLEQSIKFSIQALWISQWLYMLYNKYNNSITK